jgi:hypothetical protein
MRTSSSSVAGGITTVLTYTQRYSIHSRLYLYSAAEAIRLNQVFVWIQPGELAMFRTNSDQGHLVRRWESSVNLLSLTSLPPAWLPLITGLGTIVSRLWS